MEYWRRDAVAQVAANRRLDTTQPQQESNTMGSGWSPLTEKEAEAQMQTGGSMPGVDPNVSRMPEHLREIVRWAEEKKAVHGLN
jgi:hypothetical protein